MPVYPSPGIYPREEDFTFYVKQISTSVCGMAGIAERGPVFQPTLCTSWEQFVRRFGGYLATSYLAYAAKSFFDNGGTQLWITRIVHLTDPTDITTATATPATVTLVDRANTPLNTLKVDGATPGTWARNVSITIEDGLINPDTEFNLLVKWNGTLVEAWRDLSMTDLDTNFAEQIINGRSSYIVVDKQTDATEAPANRPAKGTFSLAGGDDGLTDLADTDYVGDAAAHTGIEAFTSVGDLALLSVPGVTTAVVLAAGLAYCAARKYTFFLADAPYGLETQGVREFRRGEGDYEHAAFDSSYGALYNSWLQITDPLTGKAKDIPAVGAISGRIAYSDQKAGVWAAPAGIDRGKLVNVNALTYSASQTERDVLYPEGVNCLAELEDAGICIWGQKTLQQRGSDTDRINVRRLMMYIEKAISASSRYVVFEPNDPATWRALVRLITPFLQRIKDGRGLYDFRVQCDAELNTPEVRDRHELVCRVGVQPTQTAEFIEEIFTLTPTGGSFVQV